MKTVLLVLLMGAAITSKAQVKIWNEHGNKIKTKGTMLSMRTIPKNDYQNLMDNQLEADLISGITVVGMVLPYIYKIGVNTLKSATANKKEDYTKEYSSLNSIDLNDIKVLSNDGLGFTCNFDYFNKGGDTKESMSKYSFSAGYESEEQYFSVELLKADELYLPVKTKKKYDLITEVFEFTVVAKVIVHKKDKKVTKIMELGKSKICRIIPSYRTKSKSLGIIYSDGVNMPTHTENGDKIEYVTLSIVCGAKFLNPIGATKSGINSFLENNSEGIEGLLNLTIKSED